MKLNSVKKKMDYVRYGGILNTLNNIHWRLYNLYYNNMNINFIALVKSIWRET